MVLKRKKKTARRSKISRTAAMKDESAGILMPKPKRAAKRSKKAGSAKKSLAKKASAKKSAANPAKRQPIVRMLKRVRTEKLVPRKLRLVRVLLANHPPRKLQRSAQVLVKLGRERRLLNVLPIRKQAAELRLIESQQQNPRLTNLSVKRGLGQSGKRKARLPESPPLNMRHLERALRRVP